MASVTSFRGRMQGNRRDSCAFASSIGQNVLRSGSLSGTPLSTRTDWAQHLERRWNLPAYSWLSRRGCVAGSEVRTAVQQERDLVPSEGLGFTTPDSRAAVPKEEGSSWSHRAQIGRKQLEFVSDLAARVYVPLILLLVLRSTFLTYSMPISERVVCVALAGIAPELRHSARANLMACARASRRSASRLSKELDVHAVLTVVAASFTLAGCMVAVVWPSFGAFIALLCQAAFATTRRVRFERFARAYRCHPLHYRDIGATCALAALLVYSIHMGFAQFACAAALVALCAGYWMVKWTFVNVE